MFVKHILTDLYNYELKRTKFHLKFTGNSTTFTAFVSTLPPFANECLRAFLDILLSFKVTYQMKTVTKINLEMVSQKISG